MTHYDTLGVPNDASEDDIKRAYRRKAGEHHPDREGGDSERMQAVNAAYAVLSDSQRRLAYDRTGDDASPEQRIETMATKMLLDAFNQAIDHDIERDVIGAIRTGAKNTRAAIETKIVMLRRQRTKIESKRDRVRAKAGDNLYDKIVGAKLAGITAQAAGLEEQLQVIDRAQAMLDDYESNDPPAVDDVAAAAAELSRKYRGTGLFAPLNNWWSP